VSFHNAKRGTQEVLLGCDQWHPCAPLAVPILAGPGTIATAMSFASEGWVHTAVSLAAFALICCVTYLCFLRSEKLVAHLGQNGLNVMTRLMGLIVASIGVGMFLTGIGYTPGS